jgi:glycine cleavage system H protein
MKEIEELSFPESVRYADDHEWAQKLNAEKMRVGISDYAQDQLGNIVFVEMPEVGAIFVKGQECGTLESVKAVAEMYAPISGEVIAVNEALEESPGLVNQAPYTEGWILEVRPNNPSDWDELMTRDAYLEMLKGIEK